MYTLPPDYAENFGKYVWGIRGKIITLHYIQTFITNTSLDLQKSDNDEIESSFEYADKLKKPS